MKEINEAIDKAAEHELGSYQFYADTARRSGDPLLEKFFSELAKEELKHKRVLELFKESGNFKDSLNEAYNENEEYYMDVAESPQDKFDEMQLISAWKEAISKEEKAINMYKGFLEFTDSEDAKALFRKLIAFEMSHKEMLKRKFDSRF